MTGSRAVRLCALIVAVVLVVLDGPSSASAQCLPPAYHGDLPGSTGSCPGRTVAEASGVVWAVLVLAVGLWLARAQFRSRAETDADLELVDSVFRQDGDGDGDGEPRRGTGDPATGS
ncbi:hypothetical protein ACWDR3_00300 [Streptomyces sp. NPDC001002]